MRLEMSCAAGLLLLSLHVFAEATPRVVKDFSAWISDLQYDATNDCYVACYRPTAKMCASVYMGRGLDAQKVQPGESYVLTRGKEATITQHAHAWCALTFTNGVHELDGVSLMAEFQDSERQLLVQGRYAVDRNVFEKYAFVVNANGEAYDVGTKTKFHFGFPFHAPEDKTPPKLSRGMENIQRQFREEGVEAYRKALADPGVMSTRDVVKEGVTNAVSFVEEIVGMNAEEARKCLRELNSDYAALIRKMESRKRRVDYVAFCTSTSGHARIVAVARVGEGLNCRMWYYEDECGIPSLIYSQDCQRSTGSYYEYGDDGILRNLCLFKDGVNTSYHTIKDGVLQKSSDMQKAQEFISKVEEMFNRYVELDTTGTLKPFMEGLKLQAEETKSQQESK